MKIKDITISIFAIIGFVTILSSFNNQSQETHSTPESHEWKSFYYSGELRYTINYVDGLREGEEKENLVKPCTFKTIKRGQTNHKRFSQVKKNVNDWLYLK